MSLSRYLPFFVVANVVALALWLWPNDLVGQQASDRGEPTKPTDPSQALKTFQSSGMKWEQLLSEPLITQPLSVAFDDHERMWLVEYRQYPEPAGLKPQSRDVHWRIVYDKTPLPPGLGGTPGIDRISVHEDTDRDGIYEKHHVFQDNLNIATSVVPVPGGAWVLNPPYLVFYHDANSDLKADGPPEIHLEGFGLEDTHSLVNSLTMGPDGWLYGAQGSTVTGKVRRYGTGDPPIKSLGQAIWRYHPVTKKYEVFAEGGGNAFGVAFDDHGDIFSGHNGGDTRGFHYVQGGYYRKGFTKHGGLSNPFTFGYLLPMKHDPIQRFTHAMFMHDASWNRNNGIGMFCIDPLHGKVIQTELEPVGSTYQTKDIADVVSSDDKWFRPVAITQGPDGAVYVCDWYDYQVAHLYAHVGQLDRERGRVYRLSLAASPSTSLDPVSSNASPSIERWVADLSSTIRWQRDRARRMIVQFMSTATPATVERWKSILFSKLHPSNADATGNSVEYLWTIHACGWIPGTIPNEIGKTTITATSDRFANDWLEWFAHPQSDVRKWMVRLTCDDGIVETETMSKLIERAGTETDIHVLGQIASSARRLPSPQAVSVLAQLLSKPIDDSDLFLPHLIWWGIEQHASDKASILQKIVTVKESKNQNFLATFLFPRLMERWAIEAQNPSYDAMVRLLESIDAIGDSALRKKASILVIEAFERAFQKRSIKSVPKSVIEAMAKLGVPTLTLSIRQEDGEATKEGIARVKDPKTPLSLRLSLIQLAGEMKIDAFTNPLLEIVREKSVAREKRQEKEHEQILQATLSALAAFDRSEIATTILDQWPSFSENTRSVGGATLARRPSWCLLWIARCKSKEIDPKSLPVDAQRAMRWIEDESLQQELSQLYPALANISLSGADQEAERYMKMVDTEQGDPYRGKKLYRTHCGRCHLLFEDGGNIGPDLTGYQRDQTKTLLRNIVAPSLEIREGYQTWTLALSSGSVLTGFVESETDELLVIKGIDGISQTIEKEEIEQKKPQSLSIMPERILDALKPNEISDLLAYLRSTQPIMD